MLYEDIPDYEPGTQILIKFNSVDHYRSCFFFGKLERKNEETGKIEELIEIGPDLPKNPFNTSTLYVSPIAEITKSRDPPPLEKKLDEDVDEEPYSEYED